MLALRAAITLRHSCWGLGRNRSRGWELDCGSKETFAYHVVGSDATLFRFLLALYSLALEAGPRKTPPSEDSGPRLGGPAPDQAIGNGLVIVGSFLLSREMPPLRGQISGRTVPAATQGRTLSHQTQPACLRRTTRAASELGSRHLHTAGSEIRGLSPLMRTGRWPLWVITMIQRNSWTLADWLGRYLDFHCGRCGPARLGGMGWEGMVYRATMYTTSVAGPPGQTNWISQDLDSFSHNHVNQQDQINPKKLENRY